MLDDRDYMRQPEGRFSFPSVPVWLLLLLVNIIVFVAQSAGGPDASRAVFKYGALSLTGLKSGFVWQLLTFQFLHGGMGHLVFNGIALYYFGRGLESTIGKRSFLSLYLLSGFAGGLVQILLGLVSERFGGGVVGASAGICGLVAAYALMNPQSTIYAFLILPIRAVYFLPLMIAATVLFMVFPTADHVAHGAHLGGMMVGVAWVKLGWHRVFARSFEEGLHFWKPLQARLRKRELVRAASLRSRPWQQAPAEMVEELPREDFISKEVVPILEKISAHGIHSLTERERKILEVARKKMGSR